MRYKKKLTIVKMKAGEMGPRVIEHTPVHTCTFFINALILVNIYWLITVIWKLKFVHPYAIALTLLSENYVGIMK